MKLIARTEVAWRSAPTVIAGWGALRVVAAVLCVLVAWPHVGLASTLIVGNGDPSVFAGSSYTGGSQQIGPQAKDFTPDRIAGLKLWLRADQGITVVQGPVTATGTTPPTVTLSGTPANKQQQTLILTTTLGGVLTVTLFSWSLNGVTQQTNQLATGAFVLGTTGITANFNAGTYTAGDTYTSVLTVSAWADQSGNGNTASQGTAASQPAYNYSDGSYAGKATMSFAGAQVSGPGGQSLAITSFVLAAPYTMIAVGNESDAASSLDTWIESDSLVALYDNTTSGLGILYAGTNTTTSTTVKTPSVFAAVLTSATQNIYINASGSPTSSSNASNNLNGTFRVGTCSGALGIQALTGKEAEVLVYSGALTAAQIKSIFGYVTARYGIVTS